jgi:hypothetical protein
MTNKLKTVEKKHVYLEDILRSLERKGLVVSFLDVDGKVRWAAVEMDPGLAKIKIEQVDVGLDLDS